MRMPTGLLRNSSHRRIGLACLLAGGTILASRQPAFALDDSKGPAGDDHAVAQARSTGAGVNIGIVEVPGQGRTGANELGIINDSNNLGARLKDEYNFAGRVPETVGAPPLVGGAVTSGCAHTTLVADIAAGADATYTGVATGANIWYGSIDPAVDPAGDNSYRAAIDYLHKSKAVNIFNLSTRVLDLNGNDNGNNVSARFADYYIRTENVVMVKSAGNRGNDAAPNTAQITNPGDAYNIITVGASDEAFTARASYSSYWLTGDNGTASDVRGKPDLLAPGSDIYDGHIKFNNGAAPTIRAAVTADANTPDNDGTSFAAPHVTGVSAMLTAGTPQRPAGLPLGPTADTRNHLAQKAIIMNSTRKRNINIMPGDVTISRDGAATGAEASDGNYLNGNTLRLSSSSGAAVGAGQTTRDWTPSSWTSFADGSFYTSRPLDDEQGTGVLDADRALTQYNAGEQEEKAENPAGVNYIGWNREPLSADGGMDVYEINRPIPAGSFITATLVWDRILNEQQAGGGAGNGTVESGDTYVDGTPVLPDFDLFIYKGDTQLAGSISSSENVEHLHYPVPTDGNALEYSIRVDLLGSGLDLRDYALAWWTVPEPTSLSVIAIGLLGATMRRRRRA